MGELVDFSLFSDCLSAHMGILKIAQISELFHTLFFVVWTYFIAENLIFAVKHYVTSLM